MKNKNSATMLRPLIFGRLSRIIFGIITIVLIPFVPSHGLGLILIAALFFLGISFIVGGVIANPGCELTALLNLLLPSSKQLHLK